MFSKKPNNDEIANLLERIAELLEMQEANRFRIQAYRKVAQNIREAKESVAELLEQGEDTLQNRLSGVGKSLTRVIKEYVTTGRSSQLDRLQGEVSPEDLFRRVPGIGDEMAHRIASEFDIETLEDLELAAHDGRLEKMEGIGPGRVQGIRETLAGMLSRSARRRARKVASQSDRPETKAHMPPVDLILDVDAEYRRRAEAGELKKIAPRRFNPEGKAWLPVLHTQRKNWSFSALYSNTAKAHELGTTQDWVVIYYDRDEDEDQCTVITKKGGVLGGKRVIRGRERECLRYYESGKQ